MCELRCNMAKEGKGISNSVLKLIVNFIQIYIPDHFNLENILQATYTYSFKSDV